MQTEALAGGFADAPIEAAIAFRAAMGAMARPGRIHDIRGAMPPAPLSVAAGTLLLVLADGTTPVHLAGGCDTSAVRDWLTFHTGAPLARPQQASFAVGVWAELLPLEAYRIGVPDYPDRSATMIVEMQGLTDTGARLTGPGIQDTHGLNLPDLAAFQGNRALFPLGLDFFFTAGAQVAALPRTTHVEAG
ncbi:MAG: phosphonate C-P lyase system protein PhnH [Rhodobacteraceae bacterium]|nr:phosphonate C-P lyase system protein PhnH [Paracoccaceae bacterium]